ncbi:cardiolipin synthase [Maribacter polysiphoniae]|uniref:Cardiolipin synthase n=1 Tax=Maribacter polysiphoniae TaxID=429344 RepID=A0A316DKE3_9FLAO|nr:cardiolipin synthase [Maribacter polysiphoniae]MBD1263146.1 cardiolipin synthase [Maribacter polysiphoniae]PWK18355.1 cardiolipin synthase [Maribacter polysiphoniae]
MGATVALVLYFILAIAMVIRLFLYGVRPTKTLGWLLAIFTIPVGGMLFYFILGRNRKKNKFFKLKKTELVTEYLDGVDKYYQTIGEDNKAQMSELLKKHVKLVKLITKSSKFTPSFGNELVPLKDGPATFKTIFRAMQEAKYYIHIQYYIFEEGDLAQRFMAILKSKAKEGVQIRALYDGLGSRMLTKNHIRELRDTGVEIHSFLPIRFSRLLSSVNYRNHRKIVIVDGCVAFTGGINVSDKYIKGDPVLGVWHDMHLQLKGPVINSLQAVFAVDWSFASGKNDILSRPYFVEHAAQGKSIAQVVSSGPDSDYSSIHQLYIAIINAAEKYVYITNPYVIPGEVLLEALRDAAIGGVDVRILLPANSDNFLVKWTVSSYFEDYLEAGIKIYQYSDGFLHSKIIVSDDELTTIGTANLDIRSFEQNYEVNVLIYEKEFAETLRNDFLGDCKKSTQLDYIDYLKRPKINRLKEGMAKVFSPVL